MRCERGQSALEYLGILTAVVGVLIVMIALAPGLGERIACQIGAQIGVITGSGGGGCSEGQLSGEPQIPCVVADSSGKVKASLTIFSVKGGGEFRILKQRMSDDTVRVTVSGGGELGAEFGLGGAGSVDAGDVNVTGGAEVRGGVSGVGEGGGSWDFDNEDDADEFIEIMRNRARDGAIRSTLPGIGHIGTALFGEDRDVDDPDIVYIQGGVGASVTGQAGDIAGYVEGGLQGSHVLGVRLDRRTGVRTVYYQLNGTGSASAGALLGVTGQADVEGQLAVTFDKNGNMVKATVIGKGGVAGDVPALGGTVKNPADFLKSLKLVGQDQSGHRIEFQADLDLTDPANRAAFTDFLSNPLGGASGLADRFADSGQFNARTYEFDRDKYGGSLAGALGIKFGVEGSYEGVNGSLTGAWFWTPTSGGLQEWTSCR